MNITKAEQKQLDRATRMGRGALLRAMAVIHRAGSSRTQKAILEAIELAHAWDEFLLVNGALLHVSEA